MLTTELKPAVKTKRRGLLSNDAVLLDYDACPNTAIHTIVTLNKTGLMCCSILPLVPMLSHLTITSLGPHKMPYYRTKIQIR